MKTYRDWVIERLGSPSEVARFHAALGAMADSGKPVVLVGRPMSGKTTMLALIREASGGRVTVLDGASPQMVRPGHPAVYAIPLGTHIGGLFRTASVFELKPIRTAMDPAVRNDLFNASDLGMLRESFIARVA